MSSMLMNEHNKWNVFVETPLYTKTGKIHSIQEQFFKSKGPKAKIGDVCVVGEHRVLCEVIAIEKENNMLLPFEQTEKVCYGDLVTLIEEDIVVPRGDILLGKVLSANGKILNEVRESVPLQKMKLDAPPLHAFNREEITEVFETGIKSIDSMLTIGIGQKIGIFAGSGVGKSTLLGMIAKNAKADINVISLVGERGREVKDFIRKELGEEGMKKSVVVVATSDESHLMQIRAAKLATSIAEYFRNQGSNVLLMMDSVTRFADARRSVDIAVKEIPIGGKTLLMESYMKKLLERCGKTKKGSITGIYTVLVDGDDLNGPIPDLARGILDGHIVLKRELATLSHYPAISVLDSVSRIMEEIVSPNHWQIANEMRKILSIYKENELYFKLGTIQESEENTYIFECKNKVEGINTFLKQGRTDSFHFEDIVQAMHHIV
ncbi:flagellar protein export ATPase FliI [Bacillus clarus]|uniref:ATPase FliI/YscN family protein n=1 Tax=Bacillus clarus TaxID=2338372 RepID=A0A090Z1A8_9BACI|nr:flagellar protein export ATPase FliI [Bacillus clarus]KFN03955.1 ATPase FliI/YscN family protein [Bacillus clarus]RFT68500.1 flagellar protein export ATPase FliI [Bacillus clarus]